MTYSILRGFKPIFSIALISTLILMLACGTTETITKVERVEVPGETVVVEKEVVKTVEVPGQTVTKEVVKTVEVPGKTIVVEKEVEVVKVVEKVEVVEKLVEKVVIATPGPAVFAMATLDPNNKRGGTLVLSNQGPPGHFDHYAGGSVVWQGWMGTMYDNLLRQDLRSAAGTIVPDLATSWEIGDDFKTWTFKIREGVKFHDGTDLTSADIKASFDRVSSPPEGVLASYKGIFDTMTLVETNVIDSHTVEFKLEEGKSLDHAMAGFANPAIKMSSKALLDELGGNLREVDLKRVGTGPFEFVELTPDHAVVEANTNYWNKNGGPYVDKIETVWIRNFTPQLTAALTTNLIDWAMFTPPADNPTLSAAGLNHAVQLFPWFFAIPINTAHEPFDDKRVRQALALALDNGGIVEAGNPFSQRHFGGGWFPEGIGMKELSPAMLAEEKYFRAPTDEDKAEARALLAAAGFPDGEGFPTLDLMSNSHKNPWWAVSTQLQQAMLKDVLNIDAEIREVDKATWRDNKATGSFDFAINNMIWDVPVPEFYLKNAMGTCDGAPCGWNFGNYMNPELDAQLRAMELELDAKKKYALSEKLWDFLNEEVPAIPLSTSALSDHYWQESVKGIMPDGATFKGMYVAHRWDTVWLDR